MKHGRLSLDVSSQRQHIRAFRTTGEEERYSGDEQDDETALVRNNRIDALT